MRRIIAIALFSTLATASLAKAETWKGYTEVSASNLQWSYDADYSYRDAKTQRVVVLSAVGKVGASPRMGPSAPGAADGVGSVVALDCKASNMIPEKAPGDCRRLAFGSTEEGRVRRGQSPSGSRLRRGR
jgi:hypothetical protein